MKPILHATTALLALLGTPLAQAHPVPHAAHHQQHQQHQQPAAGHAEHAGHTGEPLTPIPPLTPDALQAAFPAVDPHAMQHAPAFNHFVLVDQLEAWNNARGHGQRWQAKAWLGGDIERLWLRSEGARTSGHATTWSLDALYGRALSPWWDAVAGLRHDAGGTSSQTRAAIGLQGLAPYRFDVNATLYLGGARKAELALEAEYGLLLTQRLILQPTWQARWTLQDDRRRNTGSGLGRMHTGLRLRWEITRQFAPYIGFEHERSHGTTARWQRAAGQPGRASRWVMGVRMWF